MLIISIIIIISLIICAITPPILTHFSKDDLTNIIIYIIILALDALTTIISIALTIKYN